MQLFHLRFGRARSLRSPFVDGSFKRELREDHLDDLWLVGA